MLAVEVTGQGFVRAGASFGASSVSKYELRFPKIVAMRGPTPGVDVERIAGLRAYQEQGEAAPHCGGPALSLLAVGRAARRRSDRRQPGGSPAMRRLVRSKSLMLGQRVGSLMPLGRKKWRPPPVVIPAPF